MEHIMMIVNPYSGKGKAKEMLCDIISLFGTHEYIQTVYVTSPERRSSYFAETYGADYGLALCIGGDGTLSDTVNGIMRLPYEKRPAIGYIPMGTANDVATTLRLPSDPKKAVMAVAHGSPVAFDIGQIGEDTFFTYIAAFGAFTEVSYETPQNIKNSLGHLAYVLGGIGSLATIKEHHVKIEYDGGELEGDYIFGAVSNSTSVGGILTLDPKIVDMNDGKFELLLIKAPENLADLGEIVRALTAQDYGSPMLTFLPAHKIRVHADAEMDWTLDGEFAKGRELLEIENIRDAVRVITQPAAPREEP